MWRGAKKFWLYPAGSDLVEGATVHCMSGWRRLLEGHHTSQGSSLDKAAGEKSLATEVSLGGETARNNRLDKGKRGRKGKSTKKVSICHQRVMETIAQHITFFTINFSLILLPPQGERAPTLLDLSVASCGDPGGVWHSSSEVKAAFAICMHSSKVFRKVLHVDFSRVPTSIPSCQTTRVEDSFTLQKSSSPIAECPEVFIHNHNITISISSAGQTCTSVTKSNRKPEWVHFIYWPYVSWTLSHPLLQPRTTTSFKSTPHASTVPGAGHRALFPVHRESQRLQTGGVIGKTSPMAWVKMSSKTEALETTNKALLAFRMGFLAFPSDESKVSATGILLNS